MSDIEIWRDVAGLEGLYQVSNMGNLKALSKIDNRGYYRQERYFSNKATNSGYVRDSLTKESGKPRLRLLRHRTVATAFPEICGVQQEGYEIDHINGIKTDNRACNLRWVTHQDNVANLITTQKHKKATQSEEFRRKASLHIYYHQNDKPTKQINLSTGEVIKIWNSVADITRELGYSQGNISSVCRGVRQKAYGYKWEYLY